MPASRWMNTVQLSSLPALMSRMVSNGLALQRGHFWAAGDASWSDLGTDGADRNGPVGELIKGPRRRRRLTVRRQRGYQRSIAAACHKGRCSAATAVPALVAHLRYRSQAATPRSALWRAARGVSAVWGVKRRAVRPARGSGGVARVIRGRSIDLVSTPLCPAQPQWGD